MLTVPTRARSPMPWRRILAAGLVLACWLGQGRAEDGRQGVSASPVPPPEIAQALGNWTPDEEFGAGRGLLSSSPDQPAERMENAPRVTMSLLDAGFESLFGDAYKKGEWRPLSAGTFLTEGWDELWFNGPAGREGLTPRQGWLGSDAGVFYRLWHTNFTYAHQLGTPYHGDQYTGSYHIFLPFSRRFEVALDVPFVVSNGTIDPRRGYTSNFGDLLVVPRFVISDSKALCQMAALDIRTPTGSPLNGNGLMALTPRYEFWANPVGPWVFRGMGGIGVPLNRPSEVNEAAYVVGIPSNRTSVPNQTTFHGNLALGRYFTPKGTPFGHLVLYAAAGCRIPLQGDVSKTFVSIGPGFRFEVAEKTYLLGFVEVPLTAPRAVDYLMQYSIMRVF